MGRLLVIDGDREMREFLTGYLTAGGFEVDDANNGKSGLELALGGNYDLIILDPMLPDWNCFDLLYRQRDLISTPIIVVTARGDDIDMIVALEMGADDYLIKPVNPRELVARIRAVLRRAGMGMEVRAANPNQNKIKVGDLEIDIGARTVVCSDKQVELTSVEFNLLHTLVRKAGELVLRERLTREVLGRSQNPFDRSIDVHVSKLRNKLGSTADGIERIKTIRGEGYLYALNNMTWDNGNGRY
jgi:DNA-binding response OmpR family regulator